MAIENAPGLKAAFERREAKIKEQEAQIPERIKKDAPKPALRPGGSWKARADAIDRKVREEQDAAKAKTEWAQRVKAKRKQTMGMSFRQKASGHGY